MARQTGRNGRLYLSVDGTAAASPAGFVASYETNFSTDKQDVTALGDQNKTYVGGLPDATLSGDGFYDAQPGSTTQGFYRAAVDGIARGFYLYLTSDATKDYVYGTMLFDFTLSGGVDTPLSFSFSGAAAGPVTLKSS